MKFLRQLFNRSKPTDASVMTVITPSGTKLWYRNSDIHREDGPAIEYADGTKLWYRNGQRHREDGPAVEQADGSREWYLRGQRVKVELPQFNEITLRQASALANISANKSPSKSVAPLPRLPKLNL